MVLVSMLHMSVFEARQIVRLLWQLLSSALALACD